jgi:hypothetical protein
MLSLADAYFRQTVLQELRQQPGYCAALTLTDPSTGKGMVSTGWQSRQTLTDTEAETGFYRWGMARFRDFTVGPVSREAYDIAVRIVRVNEFRSR